MLSKISLMRLLLSLKAIQDQTFDNNYNYKVQSFFLQSY
jgi:CRISPR/Cas system endoribonuclease Cas6 (RAMP superfamily)